MRGLALEGGGSRGAYHIGAVKAFLEEGYEFDGFVGTSIGAVNAAGLAGGDFDMLLNLWKNISTERLFDIEERILIKISKAKWDMGILSNVRNSLRKIIDGGGLDTSRIRRLLEEYIDEDKIRGSSKDFGMVTVSFNERKSFELFLEDIPKGKLIPYIMASACFPGFQTEVIEDVKFIDGGLYNNCPINMLIDKGYDEIIAIRTKAPGVYRNVTVPDDVRLKIIQTDEDLGSVLIFSHEKIVSNIQIGYFDGLRFLRKLRGKTYYLNPVNVDEMGARLMMIKDSVIHEVGKVLGLTEMPPNRLLFEKIIPKLASYFKLDKEFDYADFVIALLEESAKSTGIERYQVYDYDSFVSIIRKDPIIDMERTDSILNVISGKKQPLKYKVAIQLLLHGYLQII